MFSEVVDLTAPYASVLSVSPVPRATLPIMGGALDEMTIRFPDTVSRTSWRPGTRSTG
jgi:hypothetical protein